jgi:hypothetical protein
LLLLDLDLVFNNYDNLLDDELPQPCDDAFLTAQIWAKLCNPYAIRQYNNWPGFALEVAEAAYKGYGHVPTSAYVDEKVEE